MKILADSDDRAGASRDVSDDPSSRFRVIDRTDRSHFVWAAPFYTTRSREDRGAPPEPSLSRFFFVPEIVGGVTPSAQMVQTALLADVR
jgi:hypothetical protein